MNRPRRKWSIAAVLLAWCCARVAPIRADESANIDLDEIKRRVTEWKGSFVNVRVTWELRSLPESQEPVLEWPPPSDPDTARLFRRQEWIWADHGLDRLEDWSFFYDDGNSQIHSIEAFNGPKGLVFRAQFRRSGEEAPEEYLDLLLRGLGKGKPTSFRDRPPLEGLYWPVTAQWLPEILSGSEWRAEAIDYINGEPCARVGCERQSADGSAFRELLWLDLNHDCLVRRHGTGTSALGRRDFIVDEFQRIDDEIWFPKRGRIQLSGVPHENQIFVVTAAAVNESLELSQFEPPPPRVGTAVDDHGRSYKHGSSGGVTAQPVDATLRGQPTSSHGTPRSPFAVPLSGGWQRWSASLTIVAIIFLAVGFWLSRRKTENQL